MKLKKSIIIVWLTIIFSGIAYLFWHNEFVYSLPTPVPKNYNLVNCGDKINIPRNTLKQKMVTLSSCTSLILIVRVQGLIWLISKHL